MPRPPTYNVLAGYKPHTAAALLGIGPETLRYWRRELDPNPYRSHFSGGVLLAYHVLNLLIRVRDLPVARLKACPLAVLFEACERERARDLSRHWLILNLEQGTLRMAGSALGHDPACWAAHALPLAPAVAAYREALETHGLPTGARAAVPPRSVRSPIAPDPATAPTGVILP